jgi:hypothetical protein
MAMSGMEQHPLQELIARRYVQDRDCPRKLVAHVALYKRLQLGAAKPHNAPRNKPSVPPRLIEEDTALDMLIEKLILDDLNEEQETMSRASSERERA